MDFGYLYAIMVAASLAGTYAMDIPHCAAWYALSQLFAAACLLLLLSRWVLGHDFMLIALPGALGSYAQSALATQYFVDARENVAMLTAVRMLARGVGLGLSTGLTAYYGVNHDSYGGLLPLCFICCMCTLPVLPYAVFVDVVRGRGRIAPEAAIEMIETVR